MSLHVRRNDPARDQGTAQLVSVRCGMVSDENHAYITCDYAALFGRLYDRHNARLHHYAWVWLRDSNDADDAVQEVWARALLHRQDLQSEDTSQGCLVSICRTVCVDRLRARKRENAFIASCRDGPRATELHPNGSEQSSAYIAMIETIAYAMARLPARQRMVFDLRLLQGRSVAETAIELGIAKGTVKASLHQACRNVRRMIGAEDSGPEDTTVAGGGGIVERPAYRV